MHEPRGDTAPPAGPRYRRHLAEQPRPEPAVDPFASGSDDAARSGPGPWFYASYDGDCTTCGSPYEEGDFIRADGDGGWEAQDCCGKDWNG